MEQFDYYLSQLAPPRGASFLLRRLAQERDFGKIVFHAIQRSMASRHQETIVHGTAMIEIPEQQALELARGLFETYGDGAVQKALERAATLAQIGDDLGAKLWREVAHAIANSKDLMPG